MYFMIVKKIFFGTILIALMSLMACHDVSGLSKEFACNNTPNLPKLETVKDFNNLFSVRLPKYWNTKLYYDSSQSEIISADTIKNLTETYIMDFSMISSQVKIDQDLQKKVALKNKENNLENIKEFFYTIHRKKAFSNLSKGIKEGHTFHILQSYIKVSDTKFLLVKAEFYGEQYFDLRLCESIHLLDDIQFLTES